MPDFYKNSGDKKLIELNFVFALFQRYNVQERNLIKQITVKITGKNINHILRQVDEVSKFYLNCETGLEPTGSHVVSWSLQNA